MMTQCKGMRVVTGETKKSYQKKNKKKTRYRS